MKSNGEMMLENVTIHEDTFGVDLWYPDVEWHDVRFICVGLMDVRAADSIRISYDKQRDGWKIEQASTFQWPTDDDVCDPDWQEVAFIQAWAREKKEEDQHEGEEGTG